MKKLLPTAAILLVIGGLNWGLIGLLNLNLVNLLLGAIPILEKLVYILVGLSAVVVLIDKLGKK